MTDNRGGLRRDVIGLFNWDDKPWQVDYPLDRIGLPEAKRYVAFDFWGNRLLPPIEGRLKVTLPPTSCMILAVRPEADHPQVISTSRHVTQGMVDLLEEKWDAATKTLSGRSRVVAGDPYEIRVAQGHREMVCRAGTSQPDHGHGHTQPKGLLPAVADQERNRRRDRVVDPVYRLTPNSQCRWALEVKQGNESRNRERTKPRKKGSRTSGDPSPSCGFFRVFVLSGFRDYPTLLLKHLLFPHFLFPVFS